MDEATKFGIDKATAGKLKMDLTFDGHNSKTVPTPAADAPASFSNLSAPVRGPTTLDDLLCAPHQIMAIERLVIHLAISRSQRVPPIAGVDRYELMHATIQAKKLLKELKKLIDWFFLTGRDYEERSYSGANSRDGPNSRPHSYAKWRTTKHDFKYPRPDNL